MVEIKSFFDPQTATISYVVSDPRSHESVVIDSVLNYDQDSGTVTTTSADEIINYLAKQKLNVTWLLETHIHADHLTASQYLKKKVGGKIGIGAKISLVLQHWIPLLNIHDDTDLNASQFDRLINDGEVITFGDIEIKVLHTPGHTPSCVSYMIENNIFVGDALFMPDVGTGRADFPGGSAAELYDSLQRIFSLPDYVKIFCCHDYPPSSRSWSGSSLVSEQREQNILINHSTTKAEFIARREQRDHAKPIPKLLYPSIQVNLRGGNFGRAEKNNLHYIKIPVTYDIPL